MESKFAHKRVIEPKYMRKKVVFVDPDDPSASYWWPALVVPNKEIEIFKQKMDYDVQYPGEGENLVCYFEDGSYSVVAEKDQRPFDPNLPPYTEYKEGINAEKFLKDKAVELATQYFEKGCIPTTFKWLRNEDVLVSSASTGIIGSDNNHESDNTYNTDEDKLIVTEKNLYTHKKHIRKESFSNAFTESNNLNKKEANVPSKKDNNIGPSSTSNSRNSKSTKIKTSSNVSKQQTTNTSSLANKHLFTSIQNSNTNLSIQNKSTKDNQTQNDKLSHISSTAMSSTSAAAATPITTTERAPTTRAKTCSHCGEKTSLRDNSNGEPKLFCGECGQLMNSIIANGIPIIENEYYWNNFIEKKRKYPARLWGSKSNKVEMNVLNGILPINKRQKWLYRAEEMTREVEIVYGSECCKDIILDLEIINNVERTIHQTLGGTKEGSKKSFKRTISIERLAKVEEKLERQRKKLEKKAEKQRVKQIQQINKKKFEKFDMTRELIADIEASLMEGTFGSLIQSNLESKFITINTIQHNISKIIKWRRKVSAEWDDELDAFMPVPEKIHDDVYLMVYLPISELGKIIGQNSMKDYLQNLKNAFTNKKLIILIEGFEEYCRKKRLHHNRNFTNAVRAKINENQEEDQETNEIQRHKKKQPANNNNLGPDPEKIEEELIWLQIIGKCSIVHTKDISDTVETIGLFSVDISTIPYKNRNGNLNFLIEGQIRTGVDAGDTWLRMLQEIQFVAPSVAKGIVNKYPTIKSLYYAYKRCKDKEEAEKLLTSIEVFGWDKEVDTLINQFQKGSMKY
ncbi:11180_t:CDS:10 [Entrophospora sp. SA101]|nr:11180_t:CDS:10 [Entrophospora sp. SA101]